MISQISRASRSRARLQNDHMVDYKTMQVELLYLRSKPARVVGHTGEHTVGVCLRVQHATEVEVGDLHPPVLVNQQVW